MADDFDIYRRDWQSIACQRTMDVYRRAPVLRQIQTALIDQVQELDDALIDSLPARTLDLAQGANLDVIGRIVGVWPRPLEDADALFYFTVDDGSNHVDSAPVYVTGAPLAGQVPVGDVSYKRLIRAKIAKNSTKYGSAPEVQYWAQFAYGVTLSVRNVGLSDLEIVFAGTTPASLVTEILRVVSDETSDFQYNIPLPTTSRIKEVFFKPANAFAPDSDLGAPDLAPIGVGYGLNA
jgi:hypothetical protein